MKSTPQIVFWILHARRRHQTLFWILHQRIDCLLKTISVTTFA